MPAGIVSAAPSCTSAPSGAESSAKPAPPSTTSGPELWKAGPSIWARHEARNGSRAGAGSPVPGCSAVSRPRAAHAASTMDCQPVQRHRCASRADSTPWRVTGRLPCSRAARRSRIPGVQKPHWLAPAAAKAPAHRALSSGSSPSTVVTDRPATRRIAVTQATRAAPSTHTVQQPHCPWGLQPSFTERHCNCSRSASRREAP